MNEHMIHLACTGITGFLGSNIERLADKARYKLIPIPRPIRHDVQQLSSFFENNKVGYVLHLAGIPDHSFCRKEPLACFDAHVMQTLSLLEACRREDINGFVYIASDKSFGEQENCTTKTPYRPTYPYETSKACEDLIVEMYKNTYDLPVYFLRFPNFYGVGDKHRERLIPGLLETIKKGGKFTIRANMKNARQFVYVEDAAEIVLTFIDKLSNGEDVPFKNHFGTPFVKTIGEVIKDVEKSSGKKIILKFIEQQNEVKKVTLNNENNLGYDYTSWEEGLRKTIKGEISKI